MRAKDLCAQAGISYRQLDMWTRTGLVAARQDFRGPGNPRHYDVTEARVVIDAGALVRAGMNPNAALALVRTIRETGTARLGPYLVQQQPAEEPTA